MKEHKVIIDVNIWIIYFINSKTTELFNLITDNNLVVYSDNYLRDELLNVINRKKFTKYFNDKSIEFNIGVFDGIVRINPTLKQFSGSPDKKDDYLFDLALQTKSKILVTGDKKLLDFKIENITSNYSHN